MPTIRRRGNTWVLCWWQGGQEHRRSLGAISRKEADTIARLKRDELARERLSGIVQLPGGIYVPTLETFATEEYLPWHATEYPSSHERIASLFDLHLLPELGQRPLDGITKTHAEQYKRKRQGRDKPARGETVAKELRALQACLNRAVFLEVIARNPIKGVKAPQQLDSKPPRWYTAVELDKLYKHSKPLPGDAAKKGKAPASAIGDYAPVWRLLANTGLRRGEAQQLLWMHVGKDSIRVLSTEEARTKSGKWRQIPLSQGASEALRELKRSTGKLPYVLPRVQPASLSRTFSSHAERAGIDGNLHCLRHTFCAHLVQAGVPLRTVQVLAGHANMVTTERYAHLAPDYLRDTVSVLNL